MTRHTRIAALGCLALACGEPEAAEVEPAAAAPETAEAPAEPADESAPTFPEDALLIATAPGRLDGEPRRVVLRWEAASDDTGVAAYELRVDGEAVTRVEAPAEEATLDDVAFEAGHDFAVVALDEADNASEPLTTDDALSPWFPEDAAMELTVGDGHTTVRWPAAEDDVGVVGYSVRRGEDEVANLGPDAREHRLASDEAAGVTVVARDAAGHKAELQMARAQVNRQVAAVAADRARARIVAALSGSSSGGALADVLGQGAVTNDVNDVLAQSDGVGVATSGGTLRRRGGGGVSSSGRGAIGGLRARPGSASASDVAPPARVRGRVRMSGPQSSTGAGRFDDDVVTRQIRARTRAIQHCYERELRRDPTLAGRVEVRFTIAETGTVASRGTTQNTTGSEAVASCVTRTVRRFRFRPGPEGGPVTYTYRFDFARAD